MKTILKKLETQNCGQIPQPVTTRCCSLCFRIQGLAPLLTVKHWPMLKKHPAGILGWMAAAVMHMRRTRHMKVLC